MKKWLIFAFCISIIGNIDATIIHVPGDYPTIQEGIDSANVGDTVLVASGVYDTTSGEVFPINMKSVYLMSEAGPENTIIDFNRCWIDRGIICDSLVDTVTIDGFTICNFGRYGAGWYQGAIYSVNSNIIIKNSIVRDNIAYTETPYPPERGAGISTYGGGMLWLKII